MRRAFGASLYWGCRRPKVARTDGAPKNDALSPCGEIHPQGYFWSEDAEGSGLDWREEALLLNVRAHGETSAIVTVFARDHGVYSGVVRGGQSRKMAPVLQSGAQVDVTWRARLEDHIGSFVVEPLRSRAANVLGGRLALAGASSVMALLYFALPEREAHKELYDRTIPLMDLLGQDDLWPLAYLRWEMAFLADLGFGLHLEDCAVTGSQSDLVYVSPKSGRAVSLQGAGEWADRLLPLPGCMRGEGDASDAEVLRALDTTGYFLHSRLAEGQVGKPLPDARQRFLDRLRKRAVL